MNLSIQKLSNKRSWQAVIGMNEKQFRKMLDCFEKSYQSLYGETVEEKKAKSPNADNMAIKTAEELLLYTLFSLKSRLTYDVLAFIMGFSVSNAKRNQDMGKKIIEHSWQEIEKLGVAGRRIIKAFREKVNTREWLKQQSEGNFPPL